MAQVLVSDSNLTAIANAIRTKLESTDTYTPEEMATAVGSIPVGQATLISKNITENGTYNASSDNADGYSSVSVNVPGGASLAGPFKVASGSVTPATNAGTLYIDIDSTDFDLSSDVILMFQLIMRQSQWANYEGDSTYDNKVAGVCFSRFKNYYETNIQNTQFTQIFLSSNANNHSYKSNGTCSVTAGQNQLTVKPYSQTGMTFIAGATYDYILVGAEVAST